MRPLVIALLIFVVAGSADAQSSSATPRNPSCSAEATSRKLDGDAKASFLKQCETDATAACHAAAADGKLAGAAKRSFTKKCIADSLGS